jgi:hypothetical protein
MFDNKAFFYYLFLRNSKNNKALNVCEDGDARQRIE